MPLGRIARFRATAQLLMGTTALQYSTDQEREHEFPRSFTALWIPCNERSNVVGSEMSPGVRQMDTASAESEPCAVQFNALGRNGGRNSDFYSARLRWKRPQRWKRDRWVMLMSEFCPSQSSKNWMHDCRERCSAIPKQRAPLPSSDLLYRKFFTRAICCTFSLQISSRDVDVTLCQSCYCAGHRHGGSMWSTTDPNAAMVSTADRLSMTSSILAPPLATTSRFSFPS